MAEDAIEAILLEWADDAARVARNSNAPRQAKRVLLLIAAMREARKRLPMGPCPCCDATALPHDEDCTYSEDCPSDAEDFDAALKWYSGRDAAVLARLKGE